MGRKSEYNDAIGDRICELVSLGSNLNTITQQDDMPAQATVYKWLADVRPFAENYARARQTRADTRFDRLDQVIADMRAGVIDANQARVEMDAIKWQAGKEKPKAYGDRITQEHTGADGGPIAVVEVVFVTPIEQPAPRAVAAKVTREIQ